MADDKVTYSAHGVETEEDVHDESYVKDLKDLSESQLLKEFHYWTVYERRIQQVVAEIKSRKENKTDGKA
jgi:hypothetical protein